MNDFWFLMLGFVLGVGTGLVIAYFAGRQYLAKMRPESAPQPEQVAEEDEEDIEAKAIDPNRPPTYQTYRPRGGVSTLKCTCHEETVEIGEKVLLWPIPGHPEGAMDVFCQRTYGQVER